MIDSLMPREAYDRLEAWNFSRLRVLAKSPKHFAHAIKYGSSDSAARKFGRVVHLAVLEPDAFEDRIGVWTAKTDAGAASPRRGKAWDAFVAAHPGKELITETEHDEAMGIANALHEDEHAAPLLSGGQSEVSIGWEFGGYGLKCRIDLVTPKYIIELKKTRNASPTAFQWDAEAYQYHAQAAWQLDGFVLATGQQREHRIIAVEDSAPYVSQVYFYTEEEIAAGRAEYQRWLTIFEECQRSNNWRGYSYGPCPLRLPRLERMNERGGSEAA